MMGGVLSENFNLDTYMALSTLLLSISLIMTTLETAFTRSRIHTRTDSSTSSRPTASARWRPSGSRRSLMIRVAPTPRITDAMPLMYTAQAAAFALDKEATQMI
jgi:hypothetical protein